MHLKVHMYTGGEKSLKPKNNDWNLSRVAKQSEIFELLLVCEA